MSEICVLERIGNVSIEKCRNSIRVRYRENGKTISKTFGEISSTTIQQAKDFALSKTSISVTSTTTIVTIVETYLTFKGNTIPYNTYETVIKCTLAWLDSIPSDLLSIEHHKIHVDILKRRYGEWVSKRIWSSFKAACNICLEIGLLTTNPYAIYDKFFPRPQEKNSRIPFERYEVEKILNCFKNDTYSVPDTKYPDSFYYPFVYFLSLTGCRPQEAIVLEKKDVFLKGTNRYLMFNKAYNGQTVSKTKTNKGRLFPINKELLTCICLAKNLSQHPNLLFPSSKGGYINLSTFTTRRFKKIVVMLCQNREIEHNLPTYHLRHFFITEMLRKQIDIATIAKLVGNTPEIILKNYLGCNSSINLPELF